MKINDIIRFVSICFCAVPMISCEVTENLDEHTAETLVHKIFNATIEDGGMTKTMLDENAVDGVRGMMWDPGDEIGIGIHGSTFRKFTNICTEAAFNGVFEGDISESNTYYAIYPWRDNMTMTTEITVNIPARQTYRANSFDINMAPMVGRGNNGESIHFQNLCGILTLNLKGTDKISSITVTAKDVRGNNAFLGGDFSVDMGYENFPYPMPTENALTEITLDCKEGVQLDSEEETSFNVIIPPGKYYGLELLIVTADGKFMKKSTSNTLEIKRSVITKSRSFEFEDNLLGAVVNLNTYGHSNCYVVSSAGVYSFDATVIGNGEFGMVPGANFHTDSPDIAPVSVDLLWEDRVGLIGGYAYDAVAGEVKFLATGKEGNALIAVKDAYGNILWSWHIWMTDQPVDQTYVNSTGTFVVQDRNLGATRADRGTGDEWKESYGTIYQWGRKDPFIKDIYELIRSSSKINGPLSLSGSVQNPTKMGVMNGSATYNPSWLDAKNGKLWTNSTKTIYDPCPVGYKVPDTYVWKGFTWDGKNTSILESISASSVKDHGFDFIYDGVNSTWYPAAPMVDWNGNYHAPDKIGRLWTTVPERSFKYATSPAITFDNTECWENYAIPVRCVKDEGYIDISYPQVIVTGFEDITSSSVKVVAEVKSEGISEVTERGFIWGMTEDLSDGIKVACESAGSVNFTIELTGLTNATKYYVKSYAVNSRGESQSSVRNFRTRYSDIETDLSAEETANCYIVTYPGTHSFDCTVRGNSEETVGDPMSAAVLWETDNTSGAINSGDIILNVHLIDQSRVQFEASGKSGNALIAVKDSDGNILWSWHIWVTDQPQDQHYSNSKGDFYLLDRNLGATRADRGTGNQWRESIGALYQWGRKDPLIQGIYTANRSIRSIESSILHPTEHATLSSWNYSSYWESNNNKSLWTPKNKTIYDPCPQGYTVADIDAYYELTVDAEPDNGYYAHIKSSTDAWFPLTPIIWCGGNYIEASTDVIVWSSCSSNVSFCRLQIPRDDKQYWLGADNSAMASPVRCMRDNN